MALNLSRTRIISIMILVGLFWNLLDAPKMVYRRVHREGGVGDDPCTADHLQRTA